MRNLINRIYYSQGINRSVWQVPCFLDFLIDCETALLRRHERYRCLIDGSLLLSKERFDFEGGDRGRI